MIKKIMVVAAMGASVFAFTGCKDNPQTPTETTTVALSSTESTAAEAETTTNVIDEAAAQLISLEHAGLEEAEVAFKKLEKAVEDGIDVIKVEFEKGAENFVYFINQSTGEIVKVEKQLIKQ